MGFCTSPQHANGVGRGVVTPGGWGAPRGSWVVRGVVGCPATTHAPRHLSVGCPWGVFFRSMWQRLFALLWCVSFAVAMDEGGWGAGPPTPPRNVGDGPATPNTGGGAGMSSPAANSLSSSSEELDYLSSPPLNWTTPNSPDVLSRPSSTI